MKKDLRKTSHRKQYFRGAFTFPGKNPPPSRTTRLGARADRKAFILEGGIHCANAQAARRQDERRRLGFIVNPLHAPATDADFRLLMSDD